MYLTAPSLDAVHVLASAKNSSQTGLCWQHFWIRGGGEKPARNLAPRESQLAGQEANINNHESARACVDVF